MISISRFTSRTDDMAAIGQIIVVCGGIGLFSGINIIYHQHIVAIIIWWIVGFVVNFILTAFFGRAGGRVERKYLMWMIAFWPTFYMTLFLFNLIAFLFSAGPSFNLVSLHEKVSRLPSHFHRKPKLLKDKPMALDENAYRNPACESCRRPL